MIKKGFRRFNRVTEQQVHSGEGELVPHPPANGTSSMEPAGSDHLPSILNEVDCGEIISGVAVPHPPRGRRAFCKKFQEEQKDNHSPYRDTINTWCRKLPHHLSMCDEVPHPSSCKMKPAGLKILPPISKKMDQRKIISGVVQPRTKDCDTVRVPLPPPSRISKMEPVAHKILPRISKGKKAGNTGSQQSTALPMTNQNGVPVPHPPSGRSFLCRNFGKEQKDNVSPHRDTFSTWCKRPVQLPDIWGTHDCDADLDPTDGTSEIADAEAPQRSSEWFAFCKQYKEEKKDKASVHQETFSSWCRQLPKVRRKDGVTDPSDVRFSRLSKLPDLPDIQVEEDHEQEIGKLWGILLGDVKRKKGRKKSAESQHYRDPDSPPEQENKESEIFTRRLAEGCWDLRCIQRIISDVEALQREEPSDLHVSSRKPSDLLVSSRKPRELLVISRISSDFSRKNGNQLDDVDQRSTASTDSWITSDNCKLLRKLHHLRTHLHFTLKSFIDERKMAQEMDKLAVHADVHAELEYERIEKTFEFYGKYKDLCLNLMLPEWHEKFHMDPEDPFHFENPQDLIGWMKSIGMCDLVDG
ncbi:uncharacterized protein LOC130552298 [Triplophysa rosa]|uniref:uncharacterized protein LOC130552298 n=1 Tax=Triplophysa rosa TaxID=992332 RepID=UPI002545EB94|nr:uncharacterized protein LOC130552298 [Triplophysa rosa]